MKFKVGDTVRILENCSGNEVGDIKKVRLLHGELFAGECDCQGKWELVDKPKSNNPD